MTLQSSGTITLAQIQSEFGGSNPIGINEYYRGGSNVPNTGTNSGIPTSGTIDFADFYSSSAVAGDDLVLVITGASTGGKSPSYGYSVDTPVGTASDDEITIDGTTYTVETWWTNSLGNSMTLHDSGGSNTTTDVLSGEANRIQITSSAATSSTEVLTFQTLLNSWSWPSGTNAAPETHSGVAATITLSQV